MKKLRLATAILLVAALAACRGNPTATHMTVYDPATGAQTKVEIPKVHAGYDAYLEKNSYDVAFPHIAESAKYYLDPKTEAHGFVVKTAGPWRIEFGRILDITMASKDVGTAFDRVEKVASPEGADGLVLSFSVENYRFANWRTEISLHITAQIDGRKIMSSTFEATGRSQRAKMRWIPRIARAGAMKSSIQDSTKSAVDKIFLELTADLKAALRAAS